MADKERRECNVLGRDVSGTCFIYSIKLYPLKTIGYLYFCGF